MILTADPWFSWSTASILRQDELPPSRTTMRYSFFWARTAIYHALKILNMEPGSRVLIPSYICRSAVDPFIAYGAEVDFYSVERDCTANILDIKKRITRNTRALLLVHYFGFPQVVRQIRELCDTHRIALIEDCAHVLSGEIEGQSIGTFGDVAVFSWRKLLPVFDGGELLINRATQTMAVALANETPLFTLRVAFNIIDRTMRHTRRPALRGAHKGLCVLEGAFHAYAKRFLERSPDSRVEARSTEFDKESIYLRMSRISRWVRRHSNVRRIINERRRNYQILLNELSASNVTPLHRELPDSVCPWVFPVFFNDILSAHRRLRAQGIPASAWDDVRHPDLPFGSFSNADFLYQNLIFLPIHQCLRDEDMMTIATAVRSL